jgi:hypothetical protein
VLGGKDGGCLLAKTKMRSANEVLLEAINGRAAAARFCRMQGKGTSGSNPLGRLRLDGCGNDLHGAWARRHSGSFILYDPAA